MSKVFTAGTFDTVHPGHVHLFQQCARIAGPDGTVIASVNTSEFVARFKNPPVQSLEDRVAMIESIRYVTQVVENNSEDLRPLLVRHEPDFLVIGSDWAQKDYHAQIGASAQWLSEHNIALLYLDRWSLHSSTELKDRVRGTAS